MALEVIQHEPYGITKTNVYFLCHFVLAIFGMGKSVWQRESPWRQPNKVALESA
jgi:hypothetical protein